MTTGPLLKYARMFCTRPTSEVSTSEQVSARQWRKQKFFMGGVSFSGIWWSFVCSGQSL